MAVQYITMSGTQDTHAMYMRMYIVCVLCINWVIFLIEYQMLKQMYNIVPNTISK